MVYWAGKAVLSGLISAKPPDVVAGGETDPLGMEFSLFF